MESSSDSKEAGVSMAKPKPEELCRLCANTDNQLIPIFKGEGLEHEIPVKLGKHLPIIKVSEFDGLPSQICYQCASTLLAWHNLYEGCSQADKRLREILVLNEKFKDDLLKDYGDDFQNDDFSDHQETEIENVCLEPSTLAVDSGIVLMDLNTSEVNQNHSISTNESELENANANGYVADKTLSKPIVFADRIRRSNSGPNRCHRSRDSYVENIQRECAEENTGGKCALGVKRDNLRCNFCPMVFLNKTDIEHHLSASHADTILKRKSNLVSSNCAKKSKTIKSLDPIVHAGKSSQNGDETVERNGDPASNRYKCQICYKVCLTMVGFRRHSATHNCPSAILSCDYCNQLFMDGESRKEHIIKFHNEIPVPIDGGKKEKSSTKSKIVESAHLNNIPVDSKVEPSYNETELGPRMTDEEYNVRAAELLKTKIFTCPECGESFDKKQSLTRHQHTHNKTGEFICEHCSRKYDSDKQLRRHLSSSHRVKRVKGPSEEDLFTRWYVYTDGQKHLKCDQCKYNSLWYHKGRFLEHYRIHTGEKPFICDLCKKQFRTKTLLQKHIMYVHEGIKEHPCDICGRRFSDKRYMEDHRRIHTGERPYVCDLCGKTFKQSASLFIHQELHKGLRKHACDMCGKRFTTRSSLNIHIKRHTGERNFVCATCGKAFVDGKHLRDHMAVHSEERPFRCDLCGSRFKLLKHLKQHGRTHKRNSNSW